MADLGFSGGLSKSIAIVATLKVVVNKFKVLLCWDSLHSMQSTISNSC